MHYAFVHIHYQVYIYNYTLAWHTCMPSLFMDMSIDYKWCGRSGMAIVVLMRDASWYCDELHSSLMTGTHTSPNLYPDSAYM